jgi:tyrosine-protein phosphatase non-receptor type 12/18/22
MDTEEKGMEKIMKEYLEKYEKEEQNGFKLMNFEFLDIRKEQASFQVQAKYSFSIGQKVEHYMRNRYRDILPYDQNRIVLENVWDPDGYINASPISHGETPTKYIASQAPLSNTTDDFWEMIVQQKVKVIAMLCKCIENDMPKCELYWPTDVGEEKTYGGVSVTNLEEEAFEDYSWRKFLIKTEKSESTIHQLHYTEWPDHGCPDVEKHILDFIELMNDLHKDHRESPILLHCSAGCGRTGTVIAANILRELINAKKLTKIDVRELVIELRKQRSSMVQTPSQYQLLNKCIAHYCRKALGKTSETVASCPPAKNPDPHESNPKNVTAAVFEESTLPHLNGHDNSDIDAHKTVDESDSEPSFDAIRL